MNKRAEKYQVRVVVGPYNTTCRTIDVWQVKQLLTQLVEAKKQKCPTCNQEVR